MKFYTLRYVIINITNKLKKLPIPISISMFIAGIFLFLFISSCKEKENETAFPTIQIMQESGFVSTDTSFTAGSQMSFNIEAKGDGLNLTNFIIQVMNDSLQTYFDTGFNSPTLSWQGKFAKTFSPDEEWHFIIRDRYGNSAEKSLHIILDTNQAFGSLEPYNTLLLGAQNNSNYGSFFSFSNGNTYTLAECVQEINIQQIIDLAYFWGPDNSTIASPGANIESGIFAGDLQDWTIRNTARFIQTGLLAEDFNNMTNDSLLIATWNEQDGKRKAKDLSAGSIYIFKTYSDRIGLFLVNSTVTGESGSIDLSIKIQSSL